MVTLGIPSDNCSGVSMDREGSSRVRWVGSQKI